MQKNANKQPPLSQTCGVLSGLQEVVWFYRSTVEVNSFPRELCLF